MVFELEKNSYSRYLGRGFNILIEISHPDFGETYYLINDTVNQTIDGQEYQAYPFDVSLPSQGESQGSSVSLSNVNQLVSNALREISKSNVNMELTLYVANIEHNASERYLQGVFEVTSPTCSLEQVDLTINLRTSLEYNVGTKRYSQQLFRNLFL